MTTLSRIAARRGALERLGALPPRAPKSGPARARRWNRERRDRAAAPAGFVADGGFLALGGLPTSPTTLAWAPNLSDESLAAQFFAFSLFPYLAFLYYTLKTKETPRLASIGFCFLLVFVFATIPAGIYAKKVYGTSLANVDWLHGSAESLLSITNLLIVFGFRRGIKEAAATKARAEKGVSKEK